MPALPPMRISFRPRHMKRYSEIAELLVRIGLTEIVLTSGLGDLLGAEFKKLTKRAYAEPEEVAQALERMGPTFVKLGQVLSTRADIVPLHYLKSLARLQDKVEEVEFAHVEATILEELGQELPKLFREFDQVPLAAASIGQVHRAVLHDGREVAVKIQRPGIRARLMEDLAVLDEVASMLEAFSTTAKRYNFTRIVDDFRRGLLTELDYRNEARNIVQLAANLERFHGLTVPDAIASHTSARVLTMTFIHGQKASALHAADRARIDGDRLAEELLRAYIHQVCVDGFFHADPHPGNVLVTQDGQIALLDMGLVAHVSPPMRENLLRLLLAVGEAQGEDAADLAVKMGDPRDDFNERELRRRVTDLVARQQGLTASQVELGKVVLEIARAGGDTGMNVPRELTLLGKALMNLDDLSRHLAPQFDPYNTIRGAAVKTMLRVLRQGVTPAGMMARVMEMNEFTTRLPGRVNKILDRVANNDIELRVRTFDEQRWIEQVQKVANRLTLGLVIGSMIIGAATLMGQPTPDFEIFGYPGFAMLMFTGAAACGVLLIFNIVRFDRKRRRGR